MNINNNDDVMSEFTGTNLNKLTENTNNSNNSEYIDYYMLNAWWVMTGLQLHSVVCAVFSLILKVETSIN